MAGDGNVYPVGLIFVGAPGQEEQQQTTILPVSVESGKTPGGVTIKQEKPDDMSMYMQSCSSATSQGKESSVPGSSGVTIKQEVDDNDLGLSAVHAFNQIDASNEKDKEVEDRNSETYWEKRKRFTLAFAAGLRKFIQMHPELLRYGPKKSQDRASATVTSSGAAGEEEEEAMEEEVEPNPVPATPRSPRGRSPRGRRGRGSAATRRSAAEPAESLSAPTTRKRGRSMRNSRTAEEEAEQDEAFDLPGGVTIKTEPAEED